MYVSANHPKPSLEYVEYLKGRETVDLHAPQLPHYNHEKRKWKKKKKLKGCGVIWM